MAQDNFMSYLEDMYTKDVNSPVITPDTGLGMDWLNANAKGLGTAASIAGLGMSGYDALFGNMAKTNKLNQTLLKQQIASNKESMADTQKFQDTWANASNGLGKIV